MAAHYTRVAPTQYPEAMHLNLLEYLWPQGLQVAPHALNMAYDKVSGYEPIPVEQAGEQLDTGYVPASALSYDDTVGGLLFFFCELPYIAYLSDQVIMRPRAHMLIKHARNNRWAWPHIK